MPSRNLETTQHSPSPFAPEHFSQGLRSGHHNLPMTTTAGTHPHAPPAGQVTETPNLSWSPPASTWSIWIPVDWSTTTTALVHITSATHGPKSPPTHPAHHCHYWPLSKPPGDPSINLPGPTNTGTSVCHPESQRQVCSAHHCHPWNLKTDPPWHPSPWQNFITDSNNNHSKANKEITGASGTVYSQRNHTEITSIHAPQIKAKAPNVTNNVDTSIGKKISPIKADSKNWKKWLLYQMHRYRCKDTDTET